jgi:glycosyltransferase involved in cell wall biosynthesis
MVVLDTRAHAEYFREQYGLSENKCVAVFVGAEIDHFPRMSGGNDRKKTADAYFSVLFYGQFIPLHGIETIVRAAEISKEIPTIHWTIIGTGQEAEKIKKMVNKACLDKFIWIEWVNYEELKSHIHAADVCLGIFGTSGKSARVIPNKVFQIISTGKPLITRDSPAIRELFSDSDQGIYLVPAGNPEELADTIRLLSESREVSNEPYFEEKLSRISPLGVGSEFLTHLQQITGQQPE